MKKEKIIFIGAGGHSKSVLESIGDNQELVGYIDDKKTGYFCGKRIFGKKITDIEGFDEYSYFVTIGDNKARKSWFQAVKSMKLSLTNIIDKTAIISKNVVIGCGNYIGKGVIINSGVHIGDDNILNTRSIIEHECQIGSHTHISTNSVVNGNVVVEDDVFLGSSSVVIGQLVIKKHSIVGAGAVVISDVDGDSVYVGVPAKKIKSTN